MRVSTRWEPMKPAPPVIRHLVMESQVGQTVERRRNEVHTRGFPARTPSPWVTGDPRSGNNLSAVQSFPCHLTNGEFWSRQVLCEEEAERANEKPVVQD